MILISLIPIIGGIWLFIYLVTPSNPEENRYGPVPAILSLKKQEKSLLNSDLLILVIVAWMFINRITLFLFPKFNENFYSTGFFKNFDNLNTIMWAFIPLSLAFIIKNKAIKVILFILGTICLGINLYTILHEAYSII